MQLCKAEWTRRHGSFNIQRMERRFRLPLRVHRHSKEPSLLSFPTLETNQKIPLAIVTGISRCCFARPHASGSINLLGEHNVELLTFTTVYRRICAIGKCATFLPLHSRTNLDIEETLPGPAFRHHRAKGSERTPLLVRRSKIKVDCCSSYFSV